MDKEKLNILVTCYNEAHNKSQLLGLFKHLASKTKEERCAYHIPCGECPFHMDTDICGASYEQREATGNYARELLSLLDKPPVVKEL